MTSLAWLAIGGGGGVLVLGALAVLRAERTRPTPWPAAPATPPAPVAAAPEALSRPVSTLDTAELLELTAAYAERHGASHPRTLALRAETARRLQCSLDRESRP